MIEKKFKAYTLTEVLLVLMLISILISTMMVNLKPKALKGDAILKAGSNMYAQLEFAFMNILARRSKNYTMLNLIADDSTTFSITDENADSKFLALIKNSIGSMRTTEFSASYLDSTLTDSSGTSPTTKVEEVDTKWKVSDFPNKLMLKNGAYFAFKLNKNCTTNEEYIYIPATPSMRSAQNSCGLIFFDVNYQDTPNILGVDQYIIPIGKLGIK